jgi:hypothetical protein
MGEKMKISKETLAVLKNFAGINSNLLLKQGNRITTISAQKNVMASAKIAETLPIDGSFGIYELNDFLSAYTLFEDPEVNFSEKYCTIEKGNQKIKFFAAAPEMLAVPSKDSLPVNEDISFNISASQLEMIIKTAGILRSPDIAIIGAKGKLSVVVGDKKNATANNFILDLGTVSLEFKVNIKVENLKMVITDYKVSVDNKKISKFSATKGDLNYYVAIESDSVIGK